MKRKNDSTFLILWRGSNLKSLLGLFVAISIPQVIMWAEFLPFFVSIPAIVIYVFFVSYSIKIIFNIDSRIKRDNNFLQVIESQNKVIHKFVIFFIFAVIGIVQSISILDKINLEFEIRMKIISSVVMIVTLIFLLSLWVYYKNLLTKN